MVFVIFFADWRVSEPKDIIRLSIIIALPVVILLGLLRRNPWSVYASLPTFIIWLSYGLFESLNIFVIEKPNFLTALQIGPIIFVGLCSIMGVVACFRHATNLKLQSRILFLLVSLSIQALLIWIVICGWFKVTSEEQTLRQTNAMQRYPMISYLYEDRAMIYLRLHNEDRAMEAVSTALKLGNKNPELYKGLGVHLFFERKFDLAVSEFSKGMPFCGKDSVEFSTFLLFRGWSYVRMRNYDSGIADLRWLWRLRLLKEIDKSDPNLTLPSYFITQSFLIIGEYDSAIAEYEKEKKAVLKLNKKGMEEKGDLESCDFGILKMCCAKGDFLSALRYLNEAVQERDSGIGTSYYAGIINYKLRNYETAKRDFENVISGAPGDDIAEYYLSSLFASKGHTKEALEHFDKALRLGFRFFDLVSENNDFRNLRKAAGYRELLRNHFGNGGIHAEEDTLRQIFKQDRIIYRDHPYVEGRDRLLVSEDLIANDRAQAIFWMPNRQQEYRKLEQLLTEE